VGRRDPTAGLAGVKKADGKLDRNGRGSRSVPAFVT